MYIYKLLGVLLMLLLFLIRPDYLVMWGFLLLIPFLLLTKRKTQLLNLLLAAVIGFSWMLIGGNQYGYNHSMLKLLGFNSFPLFAWPLGLFAVYLIVSRLGIKHPFNRILVYCLVFWSLLLSAETIAYHVLFIRNIATAAYAGLPICGCLHAPHWMQAAYLLMGPIFSLLSEALRKIRLRLSLNL